MKLHARCSAQQVDVYCLCAVSFELWHMVDPSSGAYTAHAALLKPGAPPCTKPVMHIASVSHPLIAT